MRDASSVAILNALDSVLSGSERALAVAHDTLERVTRGEPLDVREQAARRAELEQAAGEVSRLRRMLAVMQYPDS
jgi:hypothetical protein